MNNPDFFYQKVFKIIIIDRETEDINKILNQYKKTRERERKHYHEVKKLDETFMNNNRERARNHYETNKEKRKIQYDENKDFYKCKSLYYYSLTK